MLLPNIDIVEKIQKSEPLLYIVKDIEQLASILEGEHLVFVQEKMKEKMTLVDINFIAYQHYFIYSKPNVKNFEANELLRKLGFEFITYLKKYPSKTLQVIVLENNKTDILNFLEGLLLSLYKFDKYKTDKKEGIILQNIKVISKNLVIKQEIEELVNIVQGVYIVRDLVNEPYNSLNSKDFSTASIQLGHQAGFDVEIHKMKKLKKMEMGGLIAVNQGSKVPARLVVLEYLPDHYQNDYPYVLAGKGVVYDTGGMSLKSTPNSMDFMKCDMAGGATALGLMYVIAKNKLPIHVVAIIPVTDNRPGPNAIVPGDVIKMYNGKTVEVLNTDAEGRLILADALAFAQNYKPKLVMDFATLTGSAIQAIGHEGTPYMAKVPFAIKNDLEDSGRNVYERLVELPLWNEYDKHLESDIADLKNIGGKYAGSITAAKFLQHFIAFPWIHFDIAGTAFLQEQDNYRGKQGTGVGVRLIYNFLKSQLSI